MRASKLLPSSSITRTQVNGACFRCQLACTASLRPILTRPYHYNSTRRKQSTWAQAVSVASNVFSNATTRATGGADSIDPLRMVAKEMKFLTGNIRQLLGSGHPSLDTVAKYYTQAEGKHVRPMIVLLMSRATALAPKSPRYNPNQEIADIDNPISPTTILSDVNPTAPTLNPLAHVPEHILLAGDFLLSRASVALARLRDAEVTELLATVIANLVEGEFMQLKNTAQDEKNPVWTEETISYYLQKTYLKSASLISKSCRAAALLGGSDGVTVDAAYDYGKNLGLAFQLVDDMLDYTISEKELGKPAGADLELGLATAPLIFAWKNNKELGSLVGRKFSQEGDVLRARELVLQSDGLEQTRALAEEYASRAISAISAFPDSEAKDGLIEMADKTLKRRK
ncbi:putative decaprenyl-diphosphate synthase subunit 1 protein [Botrytis fragariae]|uniref:Putative decaprenyl-diphosphate synthase subunit 1 protein n=1 Tax=Botrytis fragariae TaxID=1964551 RepID=A0A8H6AZL4_9HELO|nr:putative decaprenyl-diphosphate synthase subunit 1 protein [Botrytis fragariae]KAF5876417.1 putative decaprenyl-diphosphate synthase subunit 1 protein [Botrytis fragariae]